MRGNKIYKPNEHGYGAGYGKIPPQDKEAEEAILGVLLLEPKSVDIVLPVLSVDDFYLENHGIIYNSIVKLHVKGGSIDLLTVTDELNKTSELELIGGPYKLTQLTMDVLSSAHLLAWCMIVKEHSIKRSIIRTAGQLFADSYDPSTDALDLLSKAQLQLNNIQESFSSQKTSRFADVVFETMKEMEEAGKSDNPFLGYRTGLRSIDRVTLGLSAPDFIVMAGGTGEGKSTLALQAAMEIGINEDPVAVFNLEMKNRQIIWKVFSSLIDEEVKTIRQGKLSPEKWILLHKVINEKLANANIYLHDQGGLSIMELCSIVRTMVAKRGVKIVFIDYLQLIRGGSEKSFGTREAEVGYISRTLKALGMELNICIVALSQLSRLERGAKRMYKLSDLRESGSIEQDADGVIFIWRPSYHGVETLKPGDIPFQEDDVLFQIEKWRLGDTGLVKGKFNGKYSRFEDPDSFSSFIPLGDVLAKQRQIFDGTTSTDQNPPDDLPF
ncbi:MAG: replicative DNA helicase [Taibaiella sp.]|jgi:replicative DNA helicase